MMKILLPVDGSACSRRAAEQLLALVPYWRQTPAVHVLHVHPPVPLGRVQAHIGQEALQAHYREESEAEMRAALLCLEAAGVGTTRHIHVGQPAEVIAELASELGCDLIIMGTHGRGLVGQLVLGSVARQVIEKARCPVMVVK